MPAWRSTNDVKTLKAYTTITIAIRLRSDYDISRAIRREQKMNMSIFRRSRVVVVS